MQNRLFNIIVEKPILFSRHAAFNRSNRQSDIFQNIPTTPQIPQKETIEHKNPLFKHLSFCTINTYRNPPAISLLKGDRDEKKYFITIFSVQLRIL